VRECGRKPEGCEEANEAEEGEEAEVMKEEPDEEAGK
jgi:hypothetical protein